LRTWGAFKEQKISNIYQLVRKVLQAIFEFLEKKFEVIKISQELLSNNLSSCHTLGQVNACYIRQPLRNNTTKQSEQNNC
jgi:hypothetical protein